VLAALLVLLAAASADAAKPKVERVIQIHASGRATNGYSWQLDASRSQPGGGSVSLQFSSSTGSASYVVRRPAKVSKHWVVADFGGLGEVSVRFHSQHRDHFQPGRDNCLRFSLAIGELKGRLHFEGEQGFTRLTNPKTTAFREAISARDGCRDILPPPLLRDDRFKKASILSSCDGDAGAGFFAFETSPEKPAIFLGTKTERSPELTVIRTLELTGSARSFDVEGPKAARVVPPAPFTGKGTYRNGELTGRITAPLPGTGSVRFSPGGAELQKLESSETPKCLPPPFGLRTAGARLVTADASIADAVADFSLTPRLRHILAR
jgi:hypothetical protein